MASPVQSETFVIPAMDCPEELALIRTGLQTVAGIGSVEPNFVQRSITVRFDPTQTSRGAIDDRLRHIGFPATALSAHESPQVTTAEPSHRLRTSVAIGGTLLGLAMLSALLPTSGWWGPALAVVSTLFSGVSVANGAWRAIKLGRLDMNVLMTLAAVGALVTAPKTGEWLEAPTAMFLFGVSLWLESYSLGRTRRAVQTLLEFSPTVAHRISPACCHEQTEHRHHHKPEIHDVPADDLAVGDQILVRPGERVPTDGIITAGHAALNEASITGESLPVEKGVGETAFAGSLNGEASFQLRVTQPARNSTLAQIARLVEQTHATRSPTERFVDAFARRYTPAVIALAVIVALIPLPESGLPSAVADAWFFDWLHRALVLLVIACPCALVISTPVTIVCGLRRAAQHGILVKGGEFLEAMATVDAMAFDKTGTLTEARPRVLRVRPVAGISEADLLARAAALELHSEHPIAAAIVEAAQQSALPLPAVTQFVVHRGAGVEGQIGAETVFIGSAKFFATNNLPLPPSDESGPAATSRLFIGTRSHAWGEIELSDQPRADAAATIRNLRSLGVAPLVMLTGDNEHAARRVADAVGIDEMVTELLPHEKLREVQRLTQSRSTLAMIGDGVNDAPALAAARVGIAFGPLASATTLETADIVVLSPHLSRIVALLRLGRQTRRCLRQNIALAIGIKAAVLLLALVGWATMWLAVIADVGASLLVIANGMRLLWFREDQ